MKRRSRALALLAMVTLCCSLSLNSLQAQFTYDDPPCQNWGDFETTDPPTRLGKWVAVNGNTTLVSGHDGVNSYGYFYNYDGNGNWVEDQIISIPDPVSSLPSGYQGFVAISDNYAVLCPYQYTGGVGILTVFEKDGAGIWTELSQINVPYTSVRAQKVEIDGDQLIIASQPFSGPEMVDVYTRNGNTFDFDYQIYSGSLFHLFTNNYTFMDLDGDDFALHVSSTETRVYSKDANGQFTAFESFNIPANGPVMVSNGLLIIRQNFGNVFYKKDASGQWLSETNTLPQFSTILLVDGNYGIVNGPGYQSLFEYDGSAWTELSDSQITSGYSGTTNQVLSLPHLINGVTPNFSYPTRFTHFNCDIAPYCATITSPAEGALDVLVDAPFTWEDQIDATGYIVSVGTTPGGTDILNNEDLGDVISYTPSSLLPFSSTLYATITPYNNAGTAASCASTSFTTQGEITFSCPGPVVSSDIDGLWTLPTASTYCEVTTTCTPVTIPGFTFVDVVNDRAVYLSDVQEKWLDAQSISASNGGTLATISDQATNDLLLTAHPGTGIVHIGLNDATTEGSQEWDSGDAVGFTNFTANEPNDDNIEDRAMMKINGKWRLLKDSKKRYFIEIPCSNNLCSGPAIADFTYIGAVNNYDYYLSDAKAKYDIAQANAASLGATLATIRDQATNDLLDAADVKAFFGLNDLVTEGSYLWESGETIAYENWANNYPDVNAIEDYAAMKANGLWTMNTNKKKFFFMEVPCSSGTSPGTITITQTEGQAQGTPFPPLSNFQMPVTFEFTDDCGNIETCSYTVNVYDNNLPSKNGGNLLGLAADTPTMLLYPNPTNAEFQIETSNFIGKTLSIEIFDLQGRLVSIEKTKTGQAKMDAGDFANGIYSVVVTSDFGERISNRIIVRH